MQNSGNPAQRLFDIAKKGTKYTDSISFLVWAEVFHLSPDKNGEFKREEEADILNRINECRKLVDEVEQILLTNEKITPETQEIYLRPFSKLRKLFCKPSQLYRTHKQNSTLNETDFTLLELVIHAVDSVYKEKAINENDLKELLSEIQELYEQIINLELNENLKRVLLDMLKIMECAIHEYRIRGVERLHEALEKLVGIYIVNEELFEKNEVEEVGKVKKIMRKFGSIYSFAADTVQLIGAGEAVKTAGEVITKLLGSGQ